MRAWPAGPRPLFLGDPFASRTSLYRGVCVSGERKRGMRTALPCTPPSDAFREGRSRSGRRRQPSKSSLLFPRRPWAVLLSGIQPPFFRADTSESLFLPYAPLPLLAPVPTRCPALPVVPLPRSGAAGRDKIRDGRVSGAETRSGDSARGAA